MGWKRKTCPRYSLFLKLSVFLANFCWLGDLEKLICPWKERVAGKWTIQGVVGDLVPRISGMCLLSETYPPSPLFPLKGWILPYDHTQTDLLPKGQVAECWCTLLAGNSFITLAGSEEQINLSQQSPKMLKIASESFIHVLFVVFRSPSQNFPLYDPVSLFCASYLCISRFAGAVFRCALGFVTYRSQPRITAVYYRRFLTRGLMLRRVFTSKFEKDRTEHRRLHPA